MLLVKKLLNKYIVKQFTNTFNIKFTLFFLILHYNYRNINATGLQKTTSILYFTE